MGCKVKSGLQKFLASLEAANEIKFIDTPIDSEIEISKITDAESKSEGGGKALVFRNVKASAYPVATNIFGSDKRMAMALNVANIASAGDEIASLMKTAAPKSFSEFFNLAKKILPLIKIAPSKYKGKCAPCQEVVEMGDAVDLTKIPVLKCWPKDAGRFVTLPLVFTKPLEGGPQNLGMYRLQIFDKNTTGMHWHIHKDGAHFFHQYKKAKMRMPVAVAIGAEPEVIYSATAPLPRGIDELLLAGFFKKSGIKTVKCKTIDLEVPANAEFVLEGYVDPDELRLEGPFGDHTGYYSLADMYPVFHVTCITRKASPIYCATLVGPPPMEDCFLAKATERIFLPMLQSVMPEVKDYFLPWEGVFHNNAIVSILKEYPAHFQKLASGLWGQGQMSFCKSLIVLDEDQNPSDLKSVAKLLKERLDFSRDIIFSTGVLDVLDHSAPQPLYGSKMAIDLTQKLDGEPERKTYSYTGFEPEKLRAEISENLEFVRDVEFFDGAFCAISLSKNSRCGADILRKLSLIQNLINSCKFIAVFDDNIDVKNTSLMLWKIFNNLDCKRDILILEKNMLLDACKKCPADGHDREWPDELSFDL